MTARLVAKKFVLSNYFKGLPKISDFKLVEETLPNALNQGEILCQAEYLSVDPYMRPYSASLKLGDTFIGSQVAKVIESKNSDFPPGTRVLGNFGWRNFTIHCPGNNNGPMNLTLYPLPDMKGLSESYALGAIGLPGNAAYFGLLDICKPKPGQTLVVSAAAGCAGSIAGQIGKIKGLKTIGSAGTDEKVEWLKQIGFDHAFNYKTVSIKDAISQYAPDGVDCYFDNVGGEYSFQVMRKMNMFGRISVCGAISAYNPEDGKPPLIPFDYYSLIYKNIKMEGFMVMRWTNRWFEGLHALRDWISEGKIKVRETVTEGFENTPQAFIDMLEGKNIGKAVVRA